MTDQRISTEEALTTANTLAAFGERLSRWYWWQKTKKPDTLEIVEAMEDGCATLRSLAAERDALREAMETATDCCARATACGRILRDALGENQP